MIQFFNEPDDLAWAREVHEVPEWAQSILLHGNEDCPEKIECFRECNPRFDAKPELTLHPWQG